MPALILLDLKLPKIDGVEVLRQLRAHEATRIIPVVVLSTSDQTRDMQNSYNLGANSYVRKPVDFLEFMGLVRQLGMYWTVINKLPAM
ncbi:MAG: response regulator [Litorilinea sp.]